MNEEKKITLIETLLNEPDRQVSKDIFHLSSFYIDYLYKLKKPKDVNILLISDDAIQTDDMLLKIWNNRVNIYQTFDSTFDNYVDKFKSINLDLKLTSTLYKDLKQFKDDSFDLISLDKFNTQQIAYFGASKIQYYRTIIPFKNTTSWLYQYFVAFSRKLNERPVTYEQLKQIIRRKMIDNWNDPKEKIKMFNKLNMVKNSLFNESILQIKKTLSNISLVEIFKIIDNDEYSTSIFEVEEMCKIIGVNCLIMGKGNKLFINKIYYIDANQSEYYIMLNLVKKENSRNNIKDLEFHPIVKNYNFEGKNPQFLYKIEDLPQRLRALYPFVT
jgi:hypothetical protein